MRVAAGIGAVVCGVFVVVAVGAVGGAGSAANAHSAITRRIMMEKRLLPRMADNSTGTTRNRRWILPISR